MWLLTALSADALACQGPPQDPRPLLAKADRVYRARITEVWDNNEYPGTDTCEPTEWAWDGAVVTLEVHEVWKGDVPAVIYSPVTTWGGALAGDTATFFEAFFSRDGRYFSIVSNCGWDPAVDFGPPRYTHPYEPTPEEALWEAMEDDDPVAVVQALAVAAPPEDSALWEFRAGLAPSSFFGSDRFVPRCPPESYDLLILSRYRPLERLQSCPTERILSMLPWFYPEDPAWGSLLAFLDVDTLSALEAQGVRADADRVDEGLYRALEEGREDTARWWLAHGAQPPICENWDIPSIPWAGKL